MIESKIEMNGELLNIVLSNGKNSYMLKGCMLWEDEEDGNVELFDLIEKEVGEGKSEWILVE
jgi:hypothetical protein